MQNVEKIFAKMNDREFFNRPTMSCEKFAVRVPAWVWKEVY